MTVGRLTSLPIEVVGTTDPKARLTSLPIEVVGTPDSKTRLTSINTMVLSTKGINAAARLTQACVLVLSSTAVIPPTVINRINIVSS